MKPGKARSSWKAIGAVVRVLVLCALAATGCRTARPTVGQHLMADKGRTNRNEGVAQRYAVTCPDVLAVEIAGRPDLSGPRTVGVDGRIDLEPLGRPRVEGQTADEIAQDLADRAGVPVDRVRVRVAEHHSHCVFLFGAVTGSQRAVPYYGQETVLDLLQRTGGIKEGAEPEGVYVVRPHICDGQRPEVYHVDLRAIVLRNDPKTNLRLMPYDQVHVGETQRSLLERCVPPWLRPLYQCLCG